ncbi:MAG TPA: heavy metal translocating P-type ATPase [Oscillatoriaceae cyanobacterium]
MTPISQAPLENAAAPPSVRATLALRGMTCASCAARIERALVKAPGVIHAGVNFATEKATLDYDPALTSPEALTHVVEDAGYGAEVPAETGLMPDALAAERERRERELGVLRRKLLLGGVLAVLVIAGSMGVEWLRSPIVQLLLATPVLFYVGGNFFRGALSAARHRTSNMDTLVALGTGAAYVFSAVAALGPGLFARSGAVPHLYFESAVAVIVLVLLGRYFELVARGRTSEALRKLVSLQPRTARAVRGKVERDVPIEAVAVGDRLRVRPGEQVPVDGVLLEGASVVDQSLVTGESVPVAKQVGDAIIGGTINQTGAFVMEARRVGAETMLAQIVRLVEEAQGSKAPIQRLADVFVGIFVPVVITIAILTFVAWSFLGPPPVFAHALIAAVAVLIIACPCAMGLATPTSIMVGTGKGAENGVLFRNAEALEATRRADAVVFDKTGTLTLGKPVVTDVQPAEGFEPARLLSIAAAVERQSEHPLAAAVVRRAEELGLSLPPVQDFEAVAGKGVRATVSGEAVAIGNPALMAACGLDVASRLPALEALAAEGKTPMAVLVAGRFAGTIAVADAPKPEAAAVVASLKALGLQVLMMTGDHRRTAEAIARNVGVDRVLAEVLPQEKEAQVRALQSEGRRVIMVGDGVNDAPALARADVGMAIGTGTDVAIEAADVTLLAGDLRGVLTAVALSRATIANIRQNLFWAFGYNVLGIPIAAGVLYPLFHVMLSPAIAGAAMALSSVSVVLNALRLRRFEPPAPAR